MTSAFLSCSNGRSNAFPANGIAFRRLIKLFDGFAGLSALSFAFVALPRSLGQLLARLCCKGNAGLVDAPMVGRRNKFQVLKSVVRFVSVDVVNLLGSKQRAADGFGHNEPMFVDVSVALCHRMPIAFDHHISVWRHRSAATPSRAVWSRKSTKAPSAHFLNCFRASLFARPVCRHWIVPLGNWNTEGERCARLIQGGAF